VFNDEREVLGKAVVAMNEPLVRLKPRGPLGCLDLFGKGLPASRKSEKACFASRLTLSAASGIPDENEAPAPKRKVGRASLSGCKREQRRATLSLCGIARR
jgi:hypothetical protein